MLSPIFSSVNIAHCTVTRRGAPSLFSSPRRTAGIVLCGGKSRRMGFPKALLPFGSETTLQRVIRTVESVVSPVIAVGSKKLGAVELPAGTTFVADDKSFQGPLLGLITGLEAIRDQADAVYVTGCDTPLLKPEFVQKVISQLSSDDDIAAVDDGESLQPLAAVYRTRVLPLARDLLARDERSLKALLQCSRTKRIPVAELRTIDPSLDSLANINTPDEYKALLRKIHE